MVSNRLFLFQSRNRGSFDFKHSDSPHATNPSAPFQSRNRGSFDFKSDGNTDVGIYTGRFNLAIEVLLISSQGPRR